jgi:uroporphyrinogen-III synthase
LTGQNFEDVFTGAAPEVVLTREAGKNGDLARRLAVRSISTLELPLVETGEGPDRYRLPSRIQYI